MKSGTHIKVEIISPDPQANTSLFEDVIKLVLDAEKQVCTYINIVFVSPDSLRNMKKKYFNLDVDTDIISFHLNELDEPLEGELYLSFEQIMKNAEDYACSLSSELHRVLIHGCLHLCGYEDDTVDQKTYMTSLENKYLALLPPFKT